MDDLLIVRSSERIRPRLHQRRAKMPLAANFGIILGAALGYIGATKFHAQPLVGMACGLAIGVAIGGLLASLLRPKAPRRTVYPKTHFEGIPFSVEDEKD